MKSLTVWLYFPILPSRQKTWGVVTVSVANLRAAPDHDAEMVSQAVMGTPLRILKQRGGWLFVQTPDHYLSWTNNSSVAEFTAEEMEAWKQAEPITIHWHVWGDHQ